MKKHDEGYKFDKLHLIEVALEDMSTRQQSRRMVEYQAAGIQETSAYWKMAAIGIDESRVGGRGTMCGNASAPTNTLWFPPPAERWGGDEAIFH